MAHSRPDPRLRRGVRDHRGAAATLLTPDAGEAFLGLQGDPWDTHKDMFMAYLGAIVAILITSALSKKTETSELR